jgi:hypothetical protein
MALTAFDFFARTADRVLNTIRGLKTEREYYILFVSFLINPFHRDHDQNEVLLGQGHADGASQPSSYSGNDRVAHVDVLAKV